MNIELILGVLLVLIVGSLIKFGGLTKKVKIALIIIAGFISYVLIINLFGSNKINLTSFDGFTDSIYLYVVWIVNAFFYIFDKGRDATEFVGNVIKSIG